MTRLHWIAPYPTPYYECLFNAISGVPDIDLTVYFVDQVLPIHPWKSDMTSGFRSRPFRRHFRVDWRLINQAVRDKDSYFIIGGWNDRTIFAVINLLIMSCRPFVNWTDTPNQHRKRHPLKATLRSGWIRRIFAHAKFVMGTGSPALSTLMEMGCSPHKLVNFPFFVDLQRFSPSGAGHRSFAGKHVTFLSSGRLSNGHKGFDDAIRALGVIKQQTRSLEFVYRIAGSGPDRKALEQLAAQVGIEGHVEFVGWLEPPDLPAFYRSGDVFLHPSPFDPYPVAVLEAMACGLSVIGSDKTGSVVDRIEHLRNGLIHRANDADNLTQQIMYVIENPHAIRDIGAAARCTAEQWPVERAIELVKRLIQDR